jgi:hypothetical protein
MSADEKQARLNLVRYGILLAVVVALTVTMSTYLLALAPLGQPLTAVIVPVLVALALTGLVGVAVYVGYKNYLDRR